MRERIRADRLCNPNRPGEARIMDLLKGHHLPEEDDGVRLLISTLIETVGNRVTRGLGRKFPAHAEDLRSVMHHTVVMVVAKRPITLDQHSINYVAKAVKYSLLDYVCRIPIVHASPSQTRKEFRIFGSNKITITNELEDNVLVEDFDEDDLLQTLARNDQERVIIDQRMNGLTYREIGENIGLTHGRVWQIVNSLKRRLWE